VGARDRAVTARRVAWAALAALGCAALVLGLLVVQHAVRASVRDLHPQRILPEGRAGEGAYRGFADVAFTTSDGVALSGWWHAPAGGGAVVLVHGLGANREQLGEQAQALVREGLGVLLFDLRAHGRSRGELSTWGDRERLDVEAAVDFAQAQPGVAAGRVGAAGYSIGALAVADAAEDDPRIAAVALEAMSLSAEADIETTFSRRGLLSQLPALWTARLLGVHVLDVRPADRLATLGGRPVLLLYGDRDESAPPEVGEQLRRRLARAELRIIPGAVHGGWGQDPGAVAQEVARFFARALR
jgi:uncharacterized protein